MNEHQQLLAQYSVLRDQLEANLAEWRQLSATVTTWMEAGNNLRIAIDNQTAVILQQQRKIFALLRDAAGEPDAADWSKN